LEQVKAVNGVYQNGKVTLDQPVDWPNGIPVHVLSVSPAEISGADVYVDGSASAETPEAIRDWIGWFDSLDPVLTGEDLAHFEAALALAREEQRNLLAHWQSKVDRLPQ
jgi:hypothetical protein